MPERMEIKETLHDLRNRLEQLRSRLETLSTAIWQDIDHEDPVKLEAGVRFKQRYNAQRKALDGCVDAVSTPSGTGIRDREHRIPADR